MDYLTKIYKDRCKEEFGTLGFKTYRKNFYRVVNDVFQSFDLQKSVSGGDCTIHFVVVPLCAGSSITKEYCGPDHIKMFAGDYSWFYYDRNDLRDIERCMDEMMVYMKKYMIPYFENANNSENAYYATCKFQQNCYRRGLFLADPYLYYMALRAGLYEQAIEHLTAWRKHTEEAYISNTQGRKDSPEIVKYKKRIIDKLNRLDYEIEMVSSRNMEYIQNFIAENEDIALLNLGIKK